VLATAESYVREKREVISMPIGAVITKRTIRESFDILNGRDLAKFLTYWADNAVFYYPGELSVSGKIEGKRAITQWYEKFFDQFPTFHYDIKHICIENIFAMGGTNDIAVEAALTLVNREGKEFHTMVVVKIVAQKGKAVLVCKYIFDTQILREAWGEKTVAVT
jgi:ketosteroid isomerase-like protein